MEGNQVLKEMIRIFKSSIENYPSNITDTEIIKTWERLKNNANIGGRIIFDDLKIILTFLLGCEADDGFVNSFILSFDYSPESWENCCCD